MREKTSKGATPLAPALSAHASGSDGWPPKPENLEDGRAGKSHPGGALSQTLYLIAAAMPPTARLLTVAVTVALALPAHAQETVGVPGPLRFGPLFEVGSDHPPEQTVFRHIESAAFGTNWPIVPADAYVGCARNRPRSSVLVIVDGVPWTLNPETRSAVEKQPQDLELDGQRVRVRPSNGDEAWIMDNPDPDLAGSKASLVGFLNLAQRLGCLPRAVGSR